MIIDHQPIADNLSKAILACQRLKVLIEHDQHRVCRTQVNADVDPGCRSIPEKGIFRRIRMGRRIVILLADVLQRCGRGLSAITRRLNRVALHDRIGVG